jgi:hypothetical protein
MPWEAFGMPSALESVPYFERLWPSPGIWIAGIGFGAGLGLIPAPVSTAAAAVVSVLGVVVLITLLVLTTPRLEVRNGTLVAGRARVPLDVVDTIEVLDAEQMRQARGRGLDARAYLCIRGWLPAGARVVLADAADPTPYWVVSSRRPDALAAAVSAGIARPPRRR